DRELTVESARQQAKFWWDTEVCGCASEDADVEVDEQFDVGQLLKIQAPDQWMQWLSEENRHHLADGMEGHANLVLEKHYAPKFVVLPEDENEEPRVLDGWHRFAADVAVGTQKTLAVVIRPQLKLENDCSVPALHR